MEINEPPASLSRLTSELEKEKEERRRAEQRAASLAGQLQSLHQELGGQLATEQHNQKRIAELEEELRASKAEVEQLRTDSEKLKGDRALAEKQSKIIAELKERLQKALSLFRESHEAFQKSRTELEGSLGTLSLTDPQKSNPFAPID
jgi:chromosome segregation ATPase